MRDCRYLWGWLSSVRSACTKLQLQCSLQLFSWALWIKLKLWNDFRRMDFCPCCQEEIQIGVSPSSRCGIKHQQQAKWKHVLQSPHLESTLVSSSSINHKSLFKQKYQTSADTSFSNVSIFWFSLFYIMEGFGLLVGHKRSLKMSLWTKETKTKQSINGQNNINQ